MTPEDMGDVIGDLNRRRGQIQSMEDSRGNANVIDAMVPLANMFGYINDLRSMTQGRAVFTMQFDHYAESRAAERLGRSIEEIRVSRDGGRVVTRQTRHDRTFLNPKEPCPGKGTSKFERGKGEVPTKPHVNIGTIGHVDHGKTTLTAAITEVLGEFRAPMTRSTARPDRQGARRARADHDLDRARRVPDRARHYAHVDCPATPTM